VLLLLSHCLNPPSQGLIGSSLIAYEIQAVIGLTELPSFSRTM